VTYKTQNTVFSRELSSRFMQGFATVYLWPAR